MDPPATREISLGSEVCLPDLATATQLYQRFHQYAHCVCCCPDGSNEYYLFTNFSSVVYGNRPMLGAGQGTPTKSIEIVGAT